MKTPAPELHSILAEPIACFVQYKRALNRKYRSEALALSLFDRFIYDDRIAEWNEIDGALIDRFLASRPRSRPRSYNHLLGVLTRFFDWAILQRLTECNPVGAKPRRETSKRIPFLFDLNDAKRLLDIARTLPDRPKGPCRALVYETIFALLYGIGLRVGEVARLNLGDVDFDRETLFIRNTKFSKTRIVPVGPKLAQRLRRYVDQRYGAAGNADTPLFSFTKGGAVNPGTISQTFHALVPKLQLRIPPGVSSPTVHCLRHSFAVGTLLRWYREGVDPNQRLIHLSTFLGHCAPSSTAVYLTITEELLHQADQRFHAYVLKGGAL
jgi:site-specific recombinase XerD